MIDAILTHFPAYTHPLTLVTDPDEVLADEDILAALTERGFTLVNEPDPVALRHHLQQLRPFNQEHPLIVVTAGPLNELPYDLWQQGHPVELALHTFFPNLSYPVVQSLSPNQRWRLQQNALPPRKLSRQASLDFVLAQVFEVEWDKLDQPAGFIAWLNSYHTQPEPMPPLLATHLLNRLESLPVYTTWPLTELLTDRAAFRRFIKEQWLLYLQQQTGQPLAETQPAYLLSFDTNDSLQDTLPQLIRSGTLAPVSVNQPERLPAWLRMGVLAPDEDYRPRRMAELLELLAEQTSPLNTLAEARWSQWQIIARTWAELTLLYFDPEVEAQEQLPELPRQYTGWQAQLDQAFLVWLRRHYTPLGGRKLPMPHHLYHIPAYIAYQQQQQTSAGPIALLIIDGLSLADWHLIGPAWRLRHSDWSWQEHLVLAQIPTITAISRQALVSGLRPANLSDTLAHNRAEPEHWTAFWTGQGWPPSACYYTHLALNRNEPPPELESTRHQALCLVISAIDDLVHRAGLGATDLQASLKLWLKRESPRLEAILDRLLDRGYTVYLTSDHGHTEAQGMGQPSEGIIVETRSKRARVYRDKRLAEATQQGYAETTLWGDDGLLPAEVWSLLPTGRNAFARFNEIVVTHGGPTLDEVVVPLVQITRQL